MLGKAIVLFGLFLAVSAKLPISGKENYIKANVVGRSLAKKASAQKLTCYEGPQQSGDSMVLIDYAPTLFNYDFNNRAKSCCFYGIWLLYDGENYNEGSPTLPSYNGWGENYCVDFNSAFSMLASSARFTGAPDGYKYSTINLYAYDNYGGDEEYFYVDSGVRNKDDLGLSAVVSGCDPWTVYEYDYYQGRSLCLVPSDTVNCYPSFFNKSNLGSLAGQISSVKKGCFGKNVIKADLDYTLRTRKV